MSAPVAPAEPQANDLLIWYDRHRRVLPWRAVPGRQPDPYRVWLSEVMLQQTTVAAVKPYYEAFLAKFSDVESLAAAPEASVMAAWAGLGYYSRARNLHACAKLVAAQGGSFPDTEDGLRKLPGIGAYTAAAIAAIAFDQPAAAVDGNVERVITRLFAIETPLPSARPMIRQATSAIVPYQRPGDFAQAIMDLGATICTPKRPACAICPWMGPCKARIDGLQDTFPRKVRKEKGVPRRGAAFVVIRAGDEAVLLRTRPAVGLLASTAEPPTSLWLPNYDVRKALLDAPLEARWRRLSGVVKHGFTHFPLELTVFLARVAAATPAPEGMRFSDPHHLADEPLSSAMRKVLAFALAGPKIDAVPAPDVETVSRDMMIERSKPVRRPPVQKASVGRPSALNRIVKKAPKRSK